MNTVDVVVGAFVAIAGLRGFWRGFVRELFGLLALGAGILAAVHWSNLAAALIGDALPAPEVVRDGVAFVGVFLVTHVIVNLTGLLLDRLVSALLLGGVNRVVGVVFGAAKALTVAAVVLLFVHLFPPLSVIDEQIMSSSVALAKLAAGLKEQTAWFQIAHKQPG